MSTGTVGDVGRTMKSVAPNSPSEIANANPAATSAARATIGKSTSRHTRAGGAPSIAAASRRRGSMARSTGLITRMTNGIAIKACAIGTRTHDVRRSSGGLSSAMRNPNPTVTADTPSGSDTTASSAASASSCERDRAAATDDDREHGSEHGVSQRCTDCFEWRDEERAAPMQLVERAIEVEPVSGWRVQRPFDEGGDRAAEQQRHHREICRDGEAFARRPRAVRGLRRRAQPERGPFATLDPRGDAEQHRRSPRSCTIVSAAASGRFRSWAVCR